MANDLPGQVVTVRRRHGWKHVGCDFAAGCRRHGAKPTVVPHVHVQWPLQCHHLAHQLRHVQCEPKQPRNTLVESPTDPVAGRVRPQGVRGSSRTPPPQPQGATGARTPHQSGAGTLDEVPGQPGRPRGATSTSRRAVRVTAAGRAATAARQVRQAVLADCARPLALLSRPCVGDVGRPVPCRCRTPRAEPTVTNSQPPPARNTGSASPACPTSRAGRPKPELRRCAINRRRRGTAT